MGGWVGGWFPRQGTNPLTLTSPPHARPPAHSLLLLLLLASTLPLLPHLPRSRRSWPSCWLRTVLRSGRRPCSLWARSSGRRTARAAAAAQAAPPAARRGPGRLRRGVGVGRRQGRRQTPPRRRCRRGSGWRWSGRWPARCWRWCMTPARSSGGCQLGRGIINWEACSLRHWGVEGGAVVRWRMALGPEHRGAGGPRCA